MTDISAGSVSVDVVPDARLFAEKLRAKLGKLVATVHAEADDGEAKAKLDETARERKSKIKADADTAQAEEKLDKTARPRTAKIKAHADTKSAEKNLSNLTAIAVGLGPALVPITVAAGGLAAALSAPLVAAGGGLTLFGFIAGAAVKQTEAQKKQIDELAKKVQAARSGLASANASASAQVTNSSASAQRSAAASLTTAQRSANQSIASAKRSLATATTAAGRAAAQQRIENARATLSARQSSIQQSVANSAASASASADTRRAAAQQKLNDALKQYHTALDQLTPAQKRFLGAKDDLKAAFGGFLTTSGPMVFAPLTAGLKDLTHLLPAAEPVVKSVSGALTTLLDGFDRSAKSGSVERFVGFLSRASGPSIVALGTDLGHIGSGIAGIVEASAPLSGGVMSGISHTLADFSKWGQDAGTNNFQDFLAYVDEEGPHVARLLGDTAGALGAIARDAAPLGGHIVDGLDVFARVLHRVADSKAGPMLVEAAVGFVALRKALELGSAVKNATIFSKLLSLGSKNGGSLGTRLKGLFGLGGEAATTFGGVKLGKGVVPVFVTNEGFGRPGVPGVPVNPGGEGSSAARTAAEADAANAARRGIVNSVGRRIFGGAKDALPGFEKTGSLASRFGGLAGDLLSPVASFTLGDAGNEVRKGLVPLSDPRVVAAIARQNASSIKSVGDALVLSKQDAADFNKQLRSQPKEIQTALKLVGVTSAIGALDAVRERLAALHSKNIAVRVNEIHAQSFGPGAKAMVPRRSGGPVMAGLAYLVGETAPEMFVPKQPGHIASGMQTARMIRNMNAAGHGGDARASQEIRGTLRLDRDGVAYIHGVARAAVNAGDARALQASRAAALSGIR